MANGTKASGLPYGTFSRGASTSSSSGGDIQIVTVVRGWDQTTAILRAFDKSFLNDFRKLMRSEVNKIKDSAIGRGAYTPAAKHFSKQTYQIRAGHKGSKYEQSYVIRASGQRVIRTKGAFSVTFATISPGKQGNIMERAGYKSGGRTPQGAALIGMLDDYLGRPRGGRILWWAYDLNKGQVLPRVHQLVDEAEKHATELLAKVT